MQIDRYNHLLFPRDNNTAPNPGNSESAPGAAVAGLAKAKQPPLVPGPAADRVAERSEGVVLKIQWPDSPAMARADASVYSNGRKPPSPPTADTDSQAQAHQQAVDRNAGVFTRITLNKDGVLEAKPQAASEAKPADFVALAVSAMREFSDEAERLKVRTTEPIAAPVDASWSSLKGLQQLAAKFNVFA